SDLTFFSEATSNEGRRRIAGPRARAGDGPARDRISRGRIRGWNHRTRDGPALALEHGTRPARRIHARRRTDGTHAASARIVADLVRAAQPHGRPAREDRGDS